MFEDIGIKFPYEPLYKTNDVLFISPNSNAYQSLIDIASKYIIIRRNTDGSLEGFIQFTRPKLLYILYKIPEVVWYYRAISTEATIQYFSSGDYISLRKPLSNNDKRDIIHIKPKNRFEKEIEELFKQIQNERQEKRELKMIIQRKDNEMLEFKENVIRRLDDLKIQFDYEITMMKREFL